MMRKSNEGQGMLQKFNPAAAIGCIVAVLAWVTGAGSCAAAQELELIAPVGNETLQFQSETFVVFFSPEHGDTGLKGLRLSLTNTTGNTLTIDWDTSYFTLPTGERSAAITDDVPDSLQTLPTQIPFRQTVELVVVPMRNVSHSEEGWSIRAIHAADGDELTLHLVLREAQQEEPAVYDFAFRAHESESTDAGEPSAPDVRLPIGWLALALGLGLVLGALLFGG